MSRIRSIKPDFWNDPDVVKCSPLARLLFIGSWNFADDYGVLKDDPDRLLIQVLPRDDVDAQALVDELVNRHLLVRRQAPDGTTVLVIRTFDQHQKIDRRAPGRWGDPADFPPIPTDPDRSPPIPTTPDHSPPLPTIRREGKGRENTPSPATPADGGASDEFDAFWESYPRKVARKEAAVAHKKARRSGRADDITAGLKRWIDSWTREGRPVEKIPHAATWLNGERWKDNPLASAQATLGEAESWAS